MSSTNAINRPTLKDVAAKAGVGLRTTKKIFGGVEYVPESTRERVLNAANEIGYRRNAIASALARARLERIGIVYSVLTTGYFPEVERGFAEFEAEYRDFGLETVKAIGHDVDVERQITALEQMLADESVTGVVLQPVSSDRLNPVIARLVDAGKPVITFGSDAPESRRLAYIGPNAYKAGRVGAQILSNYIGKAGDVLVVSRGPEHMQTVQRRQGFYDMVAEYYPNVVPHDLTIADTDATYDRIRAAVEGSEIAGIFSTYADSSIGGQVLRDLNRRDTPLVGFDNSAETAQLMREGLIKVILEQNPELIAYRALKMMFDLKFHEVEPDTVTHTDVSILTSECLPDDL